jgi:hypothetical protein
MNRLHVRSAGLVAALAFLLSAAAFGEGAPPSGPPTSSGVPYLGEAGQRRYEQYLRTPLPRAFAISESGAYGVAAGDNAKYPRRPADPKLRALELCREAAGTECVLYSVDNEVVFAKTATASFNPSTPAPGAPAMPPASPAPRAPAPAAPLSVARPERTRFAANLALAHQFKSIATLTYTDGSTATIGDALFGLNAGTAVPLTQDGQFEIQALLGFLLSRVNASNGSVSFWDFPLEVTAHVNLGAFRLGAGPALHISPMLRGDGFASGSDVTFGTTVGAVVRAEFRAQRKYGIGLDATWLRLSANGQSVDASRIGGVLSIYL